MSDLKEIERDMIQIYPNICIHVAPFVLVIKTPI